MGHPPVESPERRISSRRQSHPIAKTGQ